MRKQIGITTLELLLSLTIVSSVGAYTLSMSEEVETAITDYQQTMDLKKIREKIQTKGSVS
jgi:type II secretory pathway component PulJ